MKAPSQSGMTLLETLIALVILSLAITAAIGMVNAAQRLNEAAQKRQRIVENAYGETFLRAQMENIAPTVRETVNGIPIMDFDGSATKLRFVSASVADAETPVLQRTEIAIGEGIIILSRRPVNYDGVAESRELITFSGAMKFQFGEIGADRQLVLSDLWVNRERLPDVIVVLAASGPDAAHVPKLAATPALSSRF